MAVGPFDHKILSGLFADSAMLQIWSAERGLEHMLAFEAAWSRALGRAGLSDPDTAEKVADLIESASIDIGALRVGISNDGVAVPELVRQLKALVGKSIAGNEAIHTGATSQDVIDSALALTLKESSDLIQNRLEQLQLRLQKLNSKFGANALMGRTRMQAATPIKVTDRLRPWLQPHVVHLERLEQVRPRVERVQIGGAAGDRAAIASHQSEMVAFVAGALGLAAADQAWHSMRDGVAEYASLLSLISGTLGKMGQDIALMSQQGIDEIKLSGGGGSSAMPHKQNPVMAELLVTLASFNAVQVSGMHHALVHEQERSGAAWSLEWMLLPQMALATGRGLKVAIALCDSIVELGSSDS